MWTDVMRWKHLFCRHQGDCKKWWTSGTRPNMKGVGVNEFLSVRKCIWHLHDQKKKTLHGPMQHQIIQSLSKSENCKPVQKTVQPLILMRNKIATKCIQLSHLTENPCRTETILSPRCRIYWTQESTFFNSCSLKLVFLVVENKTFQPLKIQSSWTQAGFGDSIGAESSLVQHWPVSGPVDRYHRFRCANHYKGSFVQNREGWNQ